MNGRNDRKARNRPCGPSTWRLIRRVRTQPFRLCREWREGCPRRPSRSLSRQPPDRPLRRDGWPPPTQRMPARRSPYDARPTPCLRSLIALTPRSRVRNGMVMPRQCRVGRNGNFQYRELRLPVGIRLIRRPVPRNALFQCNFRLDFRLVSGLCDTGECGRNEEQAGTNIEYLHDFLITVIVLERSVSEGLPSGVLNNSRRFFECIVLESSRAAESPRGSLPDRPGNRKSLLHGHRVSIRAGYAAKNACGLGNAGSQRSRVIPGTADS